MSHRSDASGCAPDALLAMLDTMAYIRRFEEAVHDLFLRGEVHGSTHLCIGQEGVSAGTAAALAPADWIACTYRGHGHVLARGSDGEAYMAELLGRATGTSGGRAGSMNVVDLSRNIVGCFGIVGGSLAAATGVSLALKRRGEGVAVAFFGDGAANQAYFHECLNFSQALGLPVVYVCENNGYGEYTPTEVSTPGGVVARPRALGIHTIEVDGQEAWSVRDAVAQARAFVAEHTKPAFVEARTYRFSDHSRGDPISYRPEGEMERWRARDPILLATQALVEDHGHPAAEVDAVVRRASDRVDALLERARSAPFPDPEASPWSEFATALA